MEDSKDILYTIKDIDRQFGYRKNDKSEMFRATLIRESDSGYRSVVSNHCEYMCKIMEDNSQLSPAVYIDFLCLMDNYVFKTGIINELLREGYIDKSSDIIKNKLPHFKKLETKLSHYRLSTDKLNSTMFSFRESLDGYELYSTIEEFRERMQEIDKQRNDYIRESELMTNSLEKGSELWTLFAYKAVDFTEAYGIKYMEDVKKWIAEADRVIDEIYYTAYILSNNLDDEGDLLMKGEGKHRYCINSDNRDKAFEMADSHKQTMEIFKELM